MGVLSNVEPKEVFHFFEELTQIPRPSGKEKKVSDYLVKFAKERGLEVHQDDLYNVIIIKEASEGYEDVEPIILQGHMDMVCEKDPGVKKDMEKEGLDLVIDGDYVRAKGTTLGGDDGIAVAYALALLDSKTLKHPRLEFVCTVSEETGMYGARGIDLSPLKGHLLLNMDSENEGAVLAGCAGGCNAIVTYPVKRLSNGYPRIGIHIHGLTGGHSGSEIHKGRACSNELMGRALRVLMAATEVRLVSFENGTKNNAISREGRMVVTVSDTMAARTAIARLEKEVQAEYHAVDPNLQITVEDPMKAGGVAANADALDEASTDTVVTLLTALPQGVQRMSDNVEGLVETSLNWGIATLGERELTMNACVRSSVGTALKSLVGKVRWIAESQGAKLKVQGEYPAWEWVEKSELRDRMAKIYKKMFGKDLVIEAIHAGVECGLLSDKIPNMDAISMGPDIIDIHTPNEHLSIPSVQRMWEFLKAVIEYRA